MPIRVQRKRTKGWKMPENTVSVTRPTEWGNPFQVGHRYKWGGLSKNGIDSLMIFMEAYIEDDRFTTINTIEECLQWYKKYLDKSPRLIEKIKKELHGKNLACFCGLAAPCHADMLLEIANSKSLSSKQSTTLI